MAVKVYKPTSPGRRNMTSPTFEEITKSTPERSLVRRKSKTGGRDFN
ncbi:MAG TPA: 50S ribosomal protein L2, partial [Anaerolineales bacterium]|nr:50S ribosomal protein L2 [Anaerolineales bacterium]